MNFNKLTPYIYLVPLVFSIIGGVVAWIVAFLVYGSSFVIWPAAVAGLLFGGWEGRMIARTWDLFVARNHRANMEELVAVAKEGRARYLNDRELFLECVADWAHKLHLEVRVETVPGCVTVEMLDEKGSWELLAAITTHQAEPRMWN